MADPQLQSLRTVNQQHEDIFSDFAKGASTLKDVILLLQSKQQIGGMVREPEWKKFSDAEKKVLERISQSGGTTAEAGQALHLLHRRQARDLAQRHQDERDQQRREHIQKQADIRADKEQLRQAEEEELRRRQQMNRVLGTSTHAVEGFARGIAHGSPTGAITGVLGAGGPIGQLIAAGLSTVSAAITNSIAQRMSSIAHGGANLSPGGAQTEAVSRQLTDMARAKQEGELARQDARARLEQLQSQAINMGLKPVDNPMEALHVHGFEAEKIKASVLAQQVRETFRTGSITQGKTFGANLMAQFFERWIKEHGSAPEQFKRDIVLPGIRGGIHGGMGGGSGALQFQEEMQVGLLHREDATNEKMTELIREMIQSKDLLQRIDRGIESLAPRWD